MNKLKPINELTLHGIRIRFNRLQDDVSSLEESFEFKYGCKLLREEIRRLGNNFGVQDLSRARELLFNLNIEVQNIKNLRKMDML